MAEKTLLEKQLIARCQGLIKEYGDILTDFVGEVKKETEAPIIGNTSDEIALEYKRREGIRHGASSVLTKINSNANEK